MATRNLTDIFLLMRNNAVQSRHFCIEQNYSDSASLVQHEDGMVNVFEASKLPPEWSEHLEEAQYLLTKAEARMADLAALHKNHVSRPSLDDSMYEERQIEALSQEISKMFTKCHRNIHRIQEYAVNPRKETHDVLLAKNVVTSLVTSLQKITTTFRQDQSTYLKHLQQREERSKQFVVGGNQPKSINLFEDNWAPEQDASLANFPARVTSQQQLLLLEESNALVEHREREIQQIVKSLNDLNTIFKDLAHMVAEQGTVLDRIDYNIEHAGMKIEAGLVQLEKAERYQKMDCKMRAILVLAAATTVLLILLILIKS
nr:EOG090X0AQP [Triops cancriformis]